jgi:hypothetical protein
MKSPRYVCERFGSKNSLSPSGWEATSTTCFLYLFPARGAQTIFRAIPFTYIPQSLHTYSPMKMEQTECSETLAFKLQTPGNHPEEIIRQLESVVIRSTAFACYTTV